jgi:ADP-heptose:LPS heptosyltransferase
VAVSRGRPRVVVLRALGLGDLLASVPALRALRRAFPHNRIFLAASPTLEPLALHTGAVDAVVPAEPFARLPRVAAGAPVAVNLHGSGPESHRQLLAARPRKLIAFEHADVPESTGMPEWREDEHEVSRWCRLLRESGIEADEAHLDLEPRPELAPPGVWGATLVHPGAASPARRWPPERWAAIVRAEAHGGRRVVVTGSPREVGLARWIAAAAGLGPESVHAGRTGLLDLLGLVSAARRVICGDTGVGHLATAVGTPSVILFGPTPPSRWGPPPDRPQHRVLWRGTLGDPHAQVVDSGLAAIQVDDVLEELERLDEEAPSGVPA